MTEAIHQTRLEERSTTLSERDCAGLIGVDLVEVFATLASCFFSAFLLSGAFLFVTALAFAAGLALGFAFGLGLETAAFFSLAPTAFSAETETNFLFFFAAGSLKELFTFTSLSLATSFFSWRRRTFRKLAGRFFCLSSMNFAMAGWLETVWSFSVTIASLIICKIHQKIQIQPQEVQNHGFKGGLINQYLEVRRVCGGSGALLPSRLDQDNLLFNGGHGAIH
ncbi:glyceraldehyde-3-phosphate dehydrogenase C2 [Striga asiatica]|uniref:Glyceraldehyde-3-phosphate dehydrogenase C2 n=1 Tax=Striga asiatica TaxID=4170 RepID=A0A5A7Q1I3_STRAF|nr:glyceraldehyde-3-phosphate dehydrogenase C2 [Striga asiatica]